MKTLPKRRLGRTPIAKCWYLADAIDDISKAVRYSNKPSDLNFPLHELGHMTHAIQMMRDQWLEKWLNARSERLDQWPRIYERYL